MSHITTESSPSGNNPSLYALVIGVGAYERVRPLRGPANDARAVARYLQNLPDFTLNLRLLTDNEASKAALIDGFRTHLAQAGPADTILFYFAGHGAQEEADRSIWTTETDGKLECLVCHDAQTTKPWEFLLTDKELRYLIAPLSATGAHVVTLFDCCHSGDNTRAADLLTEAMAGQDVRERRLSQSAPCRPYEAFFFHNVLSAEQINEQGLEVAMPQGDHVQMAACESDESAVEVNGDGIFTKNLLTVLNAAHGDVSYRDLHNRVRQYMRFSFDQQPRVYVVGSEHDLLLNRGFLNRPLDPDTLRVSATYNTEKGWLLDVGAIHGVSDTDQLIQIQDSTGSESFPAQINKIGSDYTVLDLTDDVQSRLDKTQVYQATIQGLMMQAIRLHLINHGGPSADIADLLTRPAETTGQSLTDGVVIPEEVETNADYTLHCRYGLYYLTHPENDNQPLVRALPADEPQVVTRLTNYLRHIAQWEYLRNLRNPAATAPLLTVELARQGEQPLTLTEAHPAPIPVSFVQAAGQWTSTLTVNLTNPTDRPLYCTVLYLSRDFMAYPGFLPINCRLEPGQRVSLGLADKKSPTGRMDSIRLRLEEVIRQYNWPSSTEYFKLLITTDPLSEKTLAFFTLEALESPVVLSDLQKNKANRGGVDTDTDETEPLPEWSSQTLTLQLINPLVNTVSTEELNQMLTLPGDAARDNQLADFALGLYFETNTDASLNPTLKLRPDLRVLGITDEQRGLFADLSLALANKVARQLQNRQYRQNLVRYPDRIRIVAEGDSWFQYPFLLRDVIDYLSGVYSVFSVAAAGATLEDYLKNSEFLEAIAQVKPDFFLLSGGGNDLLGTYFTSFIRSEPIVGMDGPKRYLTDAFWTSLTGVKDRYTRILRLVEQGYPTVQVVVHGYDYVIPAGQDNRPGKMIWMGDVLTKNSITDSDERDAIVWFIVDTFNEQLRQLAETYSNVTYLDLRGTVRKTAQPADYWYDEIHPNDKGFLSVSSKYVSLITRLKNELVAPV
ncbi:caspase family protein [Spirosoma pollinicola]|uniref:Uncharacterized protein n=1 Tax=Spirosoma pollinicola TaxID=2057025 RepID=A0A2K8Z1D6_9BACT|nr:caspase family protein [Spirosoma pollinicola]AUD03665.1 hypothetical protein CWM47_18635 [Spirosoma pollinicola]